MAKYTILSIGPLTDAMGIADNTRGLWTASYMFSYLMQTIILEMSQKLKNEDIKDIFIVPTSKTDFLKSGNRAGLFHDRFVLKGDYASALNDVFKNVVTSFAKDVVVKAFEEANKSKYVKVNYVEQEVVDFISAYFQSYIACVDLDDNSNPILELSKYVDAVEYEPSLAPYEEKEYLFYFFRVANLALTKNFSFLTDAANDRSKNRCFKSFPEIAAWELTEKWDKRDEYFCLSVDKMNRRSEQEKLPESDAEEIYTALKKDFDKKLKPYHKYIAVVQADGDGFGKYLGSLEGNIDELQKFSDNIFSFSNDAREYIESKGGAVIIAGGDDLLFFAPVLNEKENIFTLINEIDKIFTKSFKDGKNNIDISMSYGVSVSYYKFPMQETLSMAANSLWNYAKQSKWAKKSSINEISKEKNTIHLNMQKHSGQSHSLTLPKNTDLYTKFIKLLESELNGDLALPHSLHHALKSAEELIGQVDSEGVENFFATQFDEDVHESTYKSSLESVRDIIMHLKDSDEVHHEVIEKDNKLVEKNSEIDVLFSMLSTIKLLRGDA